MLVDNYTHIKKGCFSRQEDIHILLFTRNYFQYQIKRVSHRRVWGFFFQRPSLCLATGGSDGMVLAGLLPVTDCNECWTVN